MPGVTQPPLEPADNKCMLAPMLLLLALTGDPRLLDDLAEFLAYYAPIAQA